MLDGPTKNKKLGAVRRGDGPARRLLGIVAGFIDVPGKVLAGLVIHRDGACAAGGFLLYGAREKSVELPAT